MSLLGLILPGPSWMWRWGSIVVLFAGAIGFGAIKMHEHDVRVLDEYKAEVKAAGDKQNERTQQIIAAHKSLKEISDAEARTAAAQRNAALAANHRLRDDLTSRSIVPPVAADPSGRDRVCFSREILDREFRGTVARAAERLIGIAEEGQRAADVATLCRDWTKKF